MKTLDQIKDELAKEKGWPDWSRLELALSGSNLCANWWPEVCKRAQEEALKNAAESIEYHFRGSGGAILYAEITNDMTDKENLIS